MPLAAASWSTDRPSAAATDDSDSPGATTCMNAADAVAGTQSAAATAVIASIFQVRMAAQSSPSPSPGEHLQGGFQGARPLSGDGTCHERAARQRERSVGSREGVRADRNPRGDLRLLLVGQLLVDRTEHR